MEVGTSLLGSEFNCARSDPIPTPNILNESNIRVTDYSSFRLNEYALLHNALHGFLPHQSLMIVLNVKIDLSNQSVSRTKFYSRVRESKTA